MQSKPKPGAMTKGKQQEAQSLAEAIRKDRESKEGYRSVFSYAEEFGVDVDDVMHALNRVCLHWFRCPKPQCATHRRELERESIGYEIQRDREIWSRRFRPTLAQSLQLDFQSSTLARNVQAEADED